MIIVVIYLFDWIILHLIQVSSEEPSPCQARRNRNKTSILITTTTSLIFQLNQESKILFSINCFSILVQILSFCNTVLNSLTSIMIGNMSSSSRILVTGGAGYIGSHTVLQLLLGGYKVVVVDNLDNSSKISIDRVQQLAGEYAPNVSFHKVSSFDSTLLTFLSFLFFLGLACFDVMGW